MEEFDLQRSIQETASFARDKVETILYKTTDTAAKTAGKSLMALVMALLFFVVFIFLNVSLGILISQWIGCNYSWGFFIVALFYLLILVVLWLLSPVIKTKIYSVVATIAINKISDINKQIDSSLPDNLKRNVGEAVKLDVVLSNEIDEKAVGFLIKDSERKSKVGETNFKRNLYYVKTNFKSILISMSKNKAIGVLSKNKYIAAGIGFVNSFKKNRQKKVDMSSSQTPTTNKTNRYLAGGLAALSIAAPFVKSFVWGMAISKAKRMILRKILPFKNKRKK